MKLNDGDWIFFASCGMYVSSLMMGLSINDFTFAKEIVGYIVPMGVIGIGYSMVINSGEESK